MPSRGRLVSGTRKSKNKISKTQLIKQGDSGYGTIICRLFRR